MSRNDFMILAFTRYAASSDGKIFRTTSPIGRYPKKTEVPQYKNVHGYMQVHLCVNREKRTIPVHRFVMAFYRGVSPLHVDHVDSDKTNNALSNLEYVTQRENNRRARAAKKRRAVDKAMDTL